MPTLDQIPLQATIGSNTGTGKLRSYIDNLITAQIFAPGQRIQVWTDLGGKGLMRGIFVVSYVEALSRLRRPRGLFRYFKPLYLETVNRIWSADPLPEGTTHGDFLVVE